MASLFDDELGWLIVLLLELMGLAAESIDFLTFIIDLSKLLLLGLLLWYDWIAHILIEIFLL